MPGKKNPFRMLHLFLIAGIITNCSDSGEVDKGPQYPQYKEPRYGLPKQTESRFEDPLKNIPDEGTMNFESLRIGQRNRFVFFEATHSASNGSVDFTYHPDTLVIAITGKDSEAWIITEFLTKGSSARLFPTNSYWRYVRDSVFISNLVIEDDSIQFSRPGDFNGSFSIQKAYRFPLQLVSDDFPESIGGLLRFGGLIDATPWMEYVKDYERLGKTFHRLNLYFDYRDMEVDGLGFAILYGPADGLVRIAWLNPWTRIAAGWDLIPQ